MSYYKLLGVVVTSFLFTASMSALTLSYDYSTIPIPGSLTISTDTRISHGVPLTIAGYNTSGSANLQSLPYGPLPYSVVNGDAFPLHTFAKGVNGTQSWLSLDLTSVLSQNLTSLSVLIFDLYDRYSPNFGSFRLDQQFAIPFGSTGPNVLQTRLNPTNINNQHNQSFVTGTDYTFVNSAAGPGSSFELINFDANQLNNLRAHNFNFLNIAGGYQTLPGFPVYPYAGFYFQDLTAEIPDPIVLPTPELMTWLVLGSGLALAALSKRLRAGRAHSGG